ncbi:MAPEG family protein [Actibacterium sp. 188UL27-1]|uniref:MAPEG family protein n=1 Tax=Actibacterium sp. 188UL27-1 TaxID=2786961 RepID=UPI00195BE11E|nr:MAPEG family protein [Actibacterium sp. 188UL27-1]MBM7068349.1 MAPEG family protein [Actibacterium sp. 188UL27-1]
MTPELTVLTLAALLQVVQFLLYAVPANLELGVGKTLGPRDDPNLTDGLSQTTKRLKRAMENHFEGLIFFTIAVVVVTLGDKSSGFTALCAHAYLVARILYVPAYASGLMPWRSLIWGVGFAATLAMLIAALF